MIPELGFYTLLLAGLASLAQSLLGLYGAATGQQTLMRAACRAAGAAVIMATLAFAALMAAHVTNDFSVLNVAMNSHTLKPLLYKISGTWASHEGSMLLWVFILTLFGWGMTRPAQKAPLDFRAYAAGVQGLIALGFLGFIILTSNPFARLWPAPAEGNDLNPLLQDPALAFHPPFLYLGYVGFSSVFSLAAALLLSVPKHDPAGLAAALRPWALLSWGALTFGIAMGSWWAYYELGWGGYWFWDPVENAALMPWLAGTALLHSVVVSAQRGALMRWTVLLSIIAFGLSVLGTFLVRSGVLTSVHAFAVDPARGVFVLALLALSIGGGFALYAARAPHLPESAPFSPISREAALLLNNLFLCTACATLVTGTLYPILLNVLTGDIVSVGAPYFNMTVLPLLIPVAGLMVAGPLLRWEQGDMKPVLRQLKLAGILFAFGIMGILYLYGYHSAFGLIGVPLGLWVLGGTFADARRFYNAAGLRLLIPQLPRLLAHGGLGLMILGLGGSMFSLHTNFTMQPGRMIQAGDYKIRFLNVVTANGPNYEAARGTFTVERNNRVKTLYPEQRMYFTQAMPLSQVAISTNLLWDTYLAMGAEEEDGAGRKTRPVRFQINPLAPWIWIGGTIMALGGALGALQRLRRS